MRIMNVEIKTQLSNTENIKLLKAVPSLKESKRTTPIKGLLVAILPHCVFFRVNTNNEQIMESATRYLRELFHNIEDSDNIPSEEYELTTNPLTNDSEPTINNSEPTYKPSISNQEPTHESSSDSIPNQHPDLIM